MKNSKVVNLLFLGAAAVVWFLAFYYFERVAGSDLVRYLLAIIVGTAVYTTLFFNIKSDNSRTLHIIGFIAGAVVGFLTFRYMEFISGSDLGRHGMPFILGLTTFVTLRANTKASYFVSDCVDELIRVVFPDARAVKLGTFLVVTLVIMAGLIFGVLDMGITFVIKKLIGV